MKFLLNSLLHHWSLLLFECSQNFLWLLRTEDPVQAEDSRDSLRKVLQMYRFWKHCSCVLFSSAVFSLSFYCKGIFVVSKWLQPFLVCNFEDFVEWIFFFVIKFCILIIIVLTFDSDSKGYVFPKPFLRKLANIRPEVLSLKVYVVYADLKPGCSLWWQDDRLMFTVIDLLWLAPTLSQDEFETNKWISHLLNWLF